MTDTFPPQPAVSPPYVPTAPNMLRHIAGLYGEREAMVRGASRLTFAGLERRSAVLARGMLASGLGKGSKVALWMPNAPEFVVYLMAAARIGAIVAPLSTLYQGPEVAWVLNHADIDALITADRYLNHDYLSRLEQAFPELARQTSDKRLALRAAPHLKTILTWGEGARPWAAPVEAALEAHAARRPDIDDAFLAAVEANVTPADPVCMIHTSGSTAHPKGVVHGHGPLIRHTYQMGHAYWGGGDGDRIVSIRPLFWVAGFSATLFHALHVGSCLITPNDNSPATLLDLIETEGATAVTGDEGWFRTLQEDPGLAAAGYEPYRISLDVMALARRGPEGAAYLKPDGPGRKAPPTHHSWERFARCFGMTEMLGGHTSLPPDVLLPPDRPRYCGRGVPGEVLVVVDPVTRQPLPPGEWGELLVAGYSMMLGLYKLERSEFLTEEGFYATGDLCMIDEAGFLAFSSRLGEMLKIHGANVAPAEVELTLNALPQIERSAVVGVEPDGRETVLVAAVQMRPGFALDEAQLTADLRGQLSSFKVPKRYVALEAAEFPLTGSGKVKKSALKELMSQRLA
ncbi:MAG: acyl--CoA ligase [Caulobacteraceae bacterium]|nr:acyl--CoA ligase [Caulobacteraceae bacterium]